MEFAGPAVPLTDQDIADTAARLGVEPAVIAAVAEVESSGGGFLADGRPKILFERHIFGRRTGHVYSALHPDISDSSRGGYGAPGAYQYERLAEAIALDRTAALESASWGKFQVMGFNAEACGWPNVEAFVTDMCKSEAQHLQAFIGYCQANDLIRHLATHDWRRFTAGYNGTGQIEHYSAKLAVAYERHSAASVDAALQQIGAGPLDKIKRIQGELGVEADGIFGRRSREAFHNLLQAAGQPGI